MIKLLLTGAYNYSQNQFKELNNLGYTIEFVQDERETLNIDVSNFDVVVCNNLFVYNDISNFTNLKFIQLTSAGYDRIPLDYVKQNNIKVENAKGVYSIPMAEWVILKILEVYKKSKTFHKLQEDRQWEKQRNLLELTDKTAAIIGFGDVGTEIAKRLKVFGVHVVGVGRRKINSENLDEYYLIENIDEVLKKSDIVVLTLPHTNETHHLIDAIKIKKMKNNSVLINVSRGGVLNQSQLIEAHQRGKFLGIALDVFEEEPLSKDSLLWDLERVIVTPHNSFISEKVNDRMYKLILENLKIFKYKI